MAMKTPKTMTVSMPNEASSCVRMLRVRNHACMFARRFAILAAKVRRYNLFTTCLWKP